MSGYWVLWELMLTTSASDFRELQIPKKLPGAEPSGCPRGVFLGAAHVRVRGVSLRP